MTKGALWQIDSDVRFGMTKRGKPTSLDQYNFQKAVMLVAAVAAVVGMLGIRLAAVVVVMLDTKLADLIA